MRKQIKIGLIALFHVYLFAPKIVLATDVVRFIGVNSKAPQRFTEGVKKQSYFVELLRLTLDASKDKYGKYMLEPVDINASQARTTLFLRKNKNINIMWRMTSKGLEDQLQAIYFPLLKGLMGNRIFIIRQGEQSLFYSNMPLARLKKIPVGQGHNWPDTTILKANGFNVTSGLSPYLLKMLKYKRFDYFPRALHEPWLEIENSQDFEVEKYLMLKYISPIYFFVNKTNKRLYERLNYGLQKLHKSGQFEHYFLTHSVSKDILLKANIDKRTVYQLTNPLLSEKTKKISEDKSLWIN